MYILLCNNLLIKIREFVDNCTSVNCATVASALVPYIQEIDSRTLNTWEQFFLITLVHLLHNRINVVDYSLTTYLLKILTHTRMLKSNSKKIIKTIERYVLQSSLHCQPWFLIMTGGTSFYYKVSFLLHFIFLLLTFFIVTSLLFNTINRSI